MAHPEDLRIQLPCPADRLLPHRPPMLLIDELTARDKGSAAATATIPPDSICCDEKRGILPEFFIEIMAQTMAAANGYDMLLKNSQPRHGFIVGLDNFKLQHIPQQQKTFIIRVVTVMEIDTVRVMQAEVLANDTLVASAEIKVWQQGEEDTIEVQS